MLLIILSKCNLFKRGNYRYMWYSLRGFHMLRYKRNDVSWDRKQTDLSVRKIQRTKLYNSRIRWTAHTPGHNTAEPYHRVESTKCQTFAKDRKVPFFAFRSTGSTTTYTAYCYPIDLLLFIFVWSLYWPAQTFCHTFNNDRASLIETKCNRMQTIFSTITW